jgi:DNA-binding NarL/FixJ family response regulator
MRAEHPDTSITKEHLACLYCDLNRYEEAEPLFQQAIAVFEKTFGSKHPKTIAARRHYADLLNQKQSSGMTPPADNAGTPAALTTQKAFPAGLTAREVEVLRLVAQGLTNVRIAEQLVLSEKTVINHLTHIFNKTGCGNRVAVTTFAIRHNLV